MDRTSDENLSGRAGGQTVKDAWKKTGLTMLLVKEAEAGEPYRRPRCAPNPAAERAERSLVEEDQTCLSLTGKRRL